MENKTSSRTEWVLLYGNAQTHKHMHNTESINECMYLQNLSHTHTHLYVNYTRRRVLTMSKCPHILSQGK